MKKTNLKEKLLTNEQIVAVRQMIVKSMESVYIDVGQKPTENFYNASGKIADKIIKNTQMALLQGASFEKAVNNSKSLKKSKKSK